MLHGLGVSEGIGLGRVMLLEGPCLSYRLEETGRTREASAEQERFRQAVETFCRNTAEQVEVLRLSAGYEESLVLESHIDMIRDPVLLEEVEALIWESHSAEAALQKICGQYIDAFSSSNDELIRLRAEDIRDVCQALLCVLLGVKETTLCHAPKGTVLVVRELSPSIMSGIDKENITGIITETGGFASHSSILARALGIPTVCGVPDATQNLPPNSFVIVDGIKGEVLNEPEQPEIAAYWQRREDFLGQRRQMEILRDKKTLSADGIEYKLYCNVSMPAGVPGAIESGGEGVGLFRTEYLFMNNPDPPGEEDQFLAYSQVLQGAAGRPVVIRTLDIGGDKEVPCLNSPREENPFLGLRGIRWCLANPEVFLTQLRALLRAGLNGDLRLLLPMVSSIEELRSGRALIEKAESQLSAQGIPHAQSLPIGVMIETPAAALSADILATEADFFSIGTNDLTGYIMACDRGNSHVAGLYSVLQPAVIRILRHIIACGRNQGLPVCICGEAASDPRVIPLLISFGITGFSVSAASVLTVKNAVSHWTKEQGDRLAEAVFEMKSEAEISEYLAEAARSQNIGFLSV